MEKVGHANGAEGLWPEFKDYAYGVAGERLAESGRSMGVLQIHGQQPAIQGQETARGLLQPRSSLLPGSQAPPMLVHKDTW